MFLIDQQSPYCPGQSRATGYRLHLLALFMIFVFDVSIRQSSTCNGNNVVLPQTRIGTPTFSTQSGLQIRVDSSWLGDRGYRPVQVTATMAKPATADTLITISYQAGGWRRSRAISVESDFELAQGSKSVTSSFSIPQYSDWSNIGWEVWVDGVKDEELCLENFGFNSGTSGAVSAGLPLPGLGKANPTKLLSALFSSSSIEIQNFDHVNMPERWIDYSSLDVVATTVSSLQLVQVTSPQKLTALLRWVRAGGNLWVMEFGRDFSGLPELEKLLKANPSNLSGSATAPLRDWHFLKLGSEGRVRLMDLVKLSMQEAEEESTLSSADILESNSPNQAADSRRWFVARSYGLGTVVAFQNELNTSRQEFAAVTAALQRSSLMENLSWATRHGNDPAGGNPNFNNLLIPDVGTAPVFEFQLLISLFVIGIGPVNYWLLKRRNQLPLLLVTVPAAALAATVMLFSYGFLADGIGVRVRVRSMTMLDQQAGEAASWARLSYYAGIAPSEGLQMPVDTTIYPILPSRSENSSFGRRHINQQRSLEWNQQQQLTRGWLGSRTPTQYLAITARPTKKHLQFVTEQEQLSVTNHLDTQVLALVVQDHKGKFFVGDSIDAEGSAKLTPSNYVKAVSILRKLLTENLPQLPAGYVESKRSRRNRFSDNYGAAMSDSLMELQFEAIVSPVASGWGNGTYLAISASGIEVSLGVEGVTETDSFHVVRGTW